MDKNTAELLQEMIDIKKNTRSAIENKGVTIVGGMKTYPDAIRRISNIEGVDSNIDYTQIGWSDTNTTYQNAWDADYINTSIAYSKTYLDRCDAGEWDLYSYTDTTGVGRNIYSPFAGDVNFVYSPYVYNLSQSLCKGLYIDCTKLRCIPQLNTSNVTNMSSMFYQCNSLVTIPQMDTSNVTSMSYMFYDCTALNSIPQMDTSNVTGMSYMFGGCTSLNSIPQMDTSNVGNMSYMFSGCTALNSIPQMDTSKVGDMRSMFYRCTSLTSIPQLNTSNVERMEDMFYQCWALTSIPQMDTSNVTNMDMMFHQCSKLTSIPQMDTSKVTSMKGMFDGCRALTSIPELDASSLEMYLPTAGGRYSPLESAFYDCQSLVDFGGFKNLKVDLNLVHCRQLSVVSLMNVINNLKNLTYSERGCMLYLGETNLNKLTSSQKAIATNKGWTLS